MSKLYLVRGPRQAVVEQAAKTYIIQDCAEARPVTTVSSAPDDVRDYYFPSRFRFLECEMKAHEHESTSVFPANSNSAASQLKRMCVITDTRDATTVRALHWNLGLLDVQLAEDLAAPVFQANI